jgi:murein L,D-transpeptidase YcbB/YkuD
MMGTEIPKLQSVAYRPDSEGEFAMPGARFDRFLASTAVVVALAGPPSLVLADPTNGTAPDQAADAAKPSPDAANTAPSTGDIAKAAPKSAESGSQTEAPGAAPFVAPATAVEAAPQPTTTASEPAKPPATASQPPAASPGTTPAATAEEPAATPPATATAAAPPSPDAPVADQLRDLVNGKFDRVIGSKKDRTTIDAFYSGRNYAPIWITDGKANAHAHAAVAYLGHVDADGLDPADYPVPSLDAASDPAALANAEIRLIVSILTYAHHASIGRVHWSRVSADISYNEAAPETADVLAAVTAASDIGSALDAYEPQTPGYLSLKAKLADIRAGKIEKGKTPIGSGPVLKTGMQDERVPELRDRLGVSGDGGTTYDKGLAEAIKKFQQSHDIAATGTLTVATLDALNGRQPDHQADIIIANMERWRWMPHQLPATYVIVNLPDFTLRVMHDGKLEWMTKIVDGKPEMPTPIMTADMKFITINPTWNVPPSIVNREYLPALQQDPTVLDRMGLRVSHNPDGTIHISQPPGDKNALGRIRFNFPNKFLVYQHDTPDKYLFANDKRAFSHGCMRVQDPQRYAEVLLSLVRPGDGYSVDRIKKMIAEGGETDIQFPTFIPVNLTYQTAFVDDAGKLQFRDDMYGRDRTLLAMLKSEDRRSLDVAVEHQIDVSHREVLAIPDQPSLFGGRSLFGGGGNSYYPNRGGYSGDGFFSRLFGGFASAPPPTPRKPVTRRKETRSGNTVER